MAGYMTRKLREYACTLRTGHQNGKSLEELRQEKDAMMATIYNMLCVCLGKPPKTVTLEVRNKKKEFIPSIQSHMYPPLMLMYLQLLPYSLQPWVKFFVFSLA